MREHTLQSENAVSERSQVRDPVAQTAYIQLPTHAEQPSLTSHPDRVWLKRVDGATQHPPQIQMHSLRVGRLELSGQN